MSFVGLTVTHFGFLQKPTSETSHCTIGNVLTETSIIRIAWTNTFFEDRKRRRWEGQKCMEILPSILNWVSAAYRLNNLFLSVLQYCHHLCSFCRCDGTAVYYSCSKRLRSRWRGTGHLISYLRMKSNLVSARESNREVKAKWDFWHFCKRFTFL